MKIQIQKLKMKKINHLQKKQIKINRLIMIYYKIIKISDNYKTKYKLNKEINCYNKIHMQ